MHPGQEDGERIEQPVDGVAAHHPREQRPVRQRELEVPGDEDRVERFTGDGLPSGDDADRLDRRGLQPLESAQQLVLVVGQPLDHFLERVNVTVDPGEPHDMAGDAAWQRYEMDVRPLGERHVPRQVEQRLLFGQGGPDA